MPRVLALLAPVALVVGLVACGDDDDSPAATAAPTTTAVGSSVTSPTTSDDAGTAGSSPTSRPDTEVLGQIFPNLSGDQLDCLVDQLGDSAEAMDPSRAQAAAQACDIDPSDLEPDLSAISIPDLSGISVPANMGAMIQQIFPGLSDVQAQCLVDQLGDNFDLDKAQKVAEVCNIDPADIAPG